MNMPARRPGPTRNTTNAKIGVAPIGIVPLIGYSEGIAGVGPAQVGVCYMKSAFLATSFKVAKEKAKRSILFPNDMNLVSKSFKFTHVSERQ